MGIGNGELQGTPKTSAIIKFIFSPVPSSYLSIAIGVADSDQSSSTRLYWAPSLKRGLVLSGLKERKDPLLLAAS